MKTQNYSNHRMFYPPHHFMYLPLLAFLQVLGIWKIFTDQANTLLWILFSTVIFLFIYLALMVRQHYALGNQNRIIRLEFRQRYFELFGERSGPIEEQLNFGQIAALRFAHDDEFKELLNQALTRDITGDVIKQSITEWRPDHHRV